MEPVATDEPRPQQSQTSAATPASSARQVPVATLHQMHPSLLMASSSGDPEALRALLDADAPRAVVIVDVPAAGETPNGGAAVVQETREHHQQAPAAAAAPSLLDGVTPLGDTAFHLVAKSGSVDCARVVGSRARRLLDEPNSMGDTPLHCAARAGHRAVAAYLVGLARGEPGAGGGALLRRRNARGETALHEAVRAGSEEVVELLLAEDPELARVPASRGGASPLYLAILLRQTKLAEKLHDKDPHLSYSGPQGQNALHAAVVTGKEHVRKVLEWNQGLTALRDDRGSTPLHFAAALQGGSRRGSVCRQLFHADRAALYLPDGDGLFPIHVAAAAGERGAVAAFVGACPGSAGLRDARGRTFLHVAVERKQVGVVIYACRDRSLTWILNMQDNDGNTALHLAVQAGSLRLFCPLFGREAVNLNLTNANGQTPVDVSLHKIPPGWSYNQNSEVRIHHALLVAGATSGACRRDHFRQEYDDRHRVKSKQDIKELDRMKDLTQTLCIGSVLIATVTFGATFALPGGNKQDDHPGGGTPTLAGRYPFEAFMVANTLAFIFSSVATVSLMRSGSPMFNLLSRRVYTRVAFYFVDTSVTCLIAAFALAVYAVLEPVAPKTAIAVCVMSPLVVICIKAELWMKWAVLAGPFFVRKGPIWTIGTYTKVLVGNMLVGLWPFLLIFLWAAYGRDNLVSVLESPAPPPQPLI